MPPGRKPTRSQEEFVQAGIEFADAQGIDALTLRELGRLMGASATAVYRYFPDKQALLSAMRDALLARAVAKVDFGDDPRSVLVTIALGFRDQAREHPCLSQLMISSRLSGQTADAIPSAIGGALARLGLQGTALALGYRQLESLVVGSTVFDFSGAPLHLTERRERMLVAADLGFDAVFVDDATVEAVNEAAFRANLEVILAALIAQGVESG